MDLPGGERTICPSKGTITSSLAQKSANKGTDEIDNGKIDEGVQRMKVIK